MGVSGTVAAGEGAKDAGEASAGAEAGKGAGEAAAGLGAADAGAGAAGAFGGADALTAGLGAGAAADAAGTAGLTAGLDTAGLGAAGAAGASDLTAGLGAAGAGGAGATTAALGADAIPELTVTGTAGAGAGAGGLTAALPAAGAAGLAAAGAGGGGSGIPGGTSGVGADTGAPSATSDIGPPSPSDTGGGFLPATSDASVSGLSPDLAQSFGISPPSAVTTGSPDITDPSIFGGGDPTAAQIPASAGGGADTGDLGFGPGEATSGGGSGNFLNSVEKYLKDPKNLASLGLLGISGVNALSKPKLPGADQTALNAASGGVQSAESVIQSGGTATAEWASQKSSIDATINQQIKQQTQAIQQAAASNGEGGANSGIVQQQIASMTQNANVQRQQLYAQAQQQNVSAALSELSGSDSILTSIGNTQLAQSTEARNAAAQTASLALQLQGLKGLGNTQQTVPGG